MLLKYTVNNEYIKYKLYSNNALKQSNIIEKTVNKCLKN